MRSLVAGFAVLCLAISISAEGVPQSRVPLVKGDGSSIHEVIGNSPEVLKAFIELAHALRYSGTTPRADRELIILRTTQLRKGKYEFMAHREMALGCSWVTDDQVQHLSNWRESKVFSDRQRLILEYADQMVQSGDVDDELFARVQKTFSSQEIVELTMISGFYSGVVQFSNAVRLQPQPVQQAAGAAAAACK